MADRRWLILLGIVVAALLPFMGIPRLVHALNTVSTDDACVKIRDFRRFALECAVRGQVPGRKISLRVDPILTPAVSARAPERPRAYSPVGSPTESNPSFLFPSWR